MKKIIIPSIVRYSGLFQEKASMINTINCERIHVDVTIGQKTGELFDYDDFGIEQRRLFESSVDLHVFDFSDNWSDWKTKGLPLLQNDCIIFHIFPNTSTKMINSVINHCDGNGINIGLALDLKVNIDIIKHYINQLDIVIVMGIEAGGHQLPLNEKAINDLILVSEMSNKDKRLRIGIDGGVNIKTFEKLVNITDFVVIGGLLFNAPDIISQWNTLNRWLKEVSKNEK